MTFNILTTINLLEYDNNINKLKDLLFSIKKDSFDPTDRIVILHNDTEYFYHGHMTGFTTHNFFNLIRELNFPLFVFVFLTNFSKYQEAVDLFISDHKDKPTVYSTIVNNASYPSIASMIDGSSEKNIKFNAVCLLGTIRSHRIKLFQYLNSQTNNIKYTFNNKNAVLSDTNIKTNLETSTNNIVFSTPHRINDRWENLSSSFDFNALNSVPYFQKNDQDIGDLSFDFYNFFAVDIVAETMFDSPHVFISEKTLRPILLKTPFVMFGPCGTLAYLKSFGFKTFDLFWDESYDLIIDPVDRFMATTKIVSFVDQLTLAELKDIYESMLPILEHNRKTLIKYIDNIFKPLYTNLNVPY
jgi:hypothetical protein